MWIFKQHGSSKWITGRIKTLDMYMEVVRVGDGHEINVVTNSYVHNFVLTGPKFRPRR